MDKRLFWKRLLPLVFPIAFEQLMFSLVSASDALMLGLVDQASLSAVSLATQVQFVFSLFMFGLTSGGNVLLAQYWGKGYKAEVEQVFAIMMRPIALVGIVFTLASAFVPELLMRCFTPDPELISLGADYLRMVSLSYVTSAVGQCYLCIMKNTGKAAQSSFISSSGVVMNIVLNAVLIFGLLGAPEMGIEGAALATTITRVVSMFWGIWEVERRKEIRLRRNYLFNWKLALKKDFWKYAWVLLWNNLIWGVGITMGSVILGHLGTDAVAANSIAVVAKNLINCFCMGLASGGAILVGNELGAGQLETGRKYGEKVVTLSLISGVISGGILIALTPLIINVAELSQQSQEYLRWMIVVCAANLVGMSHNSATISGIFSAGGDTRFGLICDTITLWAIIVPLGFLAAFVWDWPVLVVYAIINMDEWVKFPAVRWNYRKYNWVRDLTKEKAQEETV